MIKKLPRSEGAVAGFEISGKIDTDRERAWIADLESTIAEHGSINVLLHLKDDARWGVKAGIEDIQWVMGHLRDIHKIAVVADSTAWEWLIAIDSKFAKIVGVDEKYFKSDEIENAWNWLKT